MQNQKESWNSMEGRRLGRVRSPKWGHGKQRQTQEEEINHPVETKGFHELKDTLTLAMHNSVSGEIPL